MTAYLIYVFVLHLQDTLVAFFWSDGSNVNEHACLRVNPSCINYIQPVFWRAIGVSRVDLKHVISSTRGHQWRRIMMYGHIIVAREEMHGR